LGSIVKAEGKLVAEGRFLVINTGSVKKGE
jgi:hypothetical protein